MKLKLLEDYLNSDTGDCGQLIKWVVCDDLVYALVKVDNFVDLWKHDDVEIIEEKLRVFFSVGCVEISGNKPEQIFDLFLNHRKDVFEIGSKWEVIENNNELKFKRIC
jgi:hypothetical protein